MTASITSREFNRDVSAAKRAAEKGPVTITDHGKPSHVLLTAADYERLSGRADLVGTRLRSPEPEAVDLVLPPRIGSSLRVPEL